MSTDLIGSFNIDTFNILNKYILEFGVFSEDGQKIVTINILNPDETKSTIDMTIGDIMYFTEYGTITLPGRYILDKILYYSNSQLDLLLDEIANGILLNDADENRIVLKLNEFIIKMEAYSKSLFINSVKNINQLGKLLNQPDENKYIYNLTKLSKYVKWKLIKKE